jgi:cell division protease FtsH
MPEDDNREEGRRGFPGGAFLLLLAAVLLIMIVQSVGPGRLAKVGFSYQLEHLVNLDLIRPDESWKTAQNDNLVSFGGQFREQLTDTGRARYRYLELLDQKTLLNDEQNRLRAELKTQGAQAVSAAAWTLQLAGSPLPKEGLVIVSAPSGEETPLILESLPARKVVGASMLVRSLETMPAQPSSEQVNLARQELETMVAQARGPLVGVGAEEPKTALRNLAEQLEPLKSMEPAKQRAAMITLARDLAKTLDSLLAPQDGVRLAGLRNVRDYVQTGLELEKVGGEVSKVEGQLDQARTAAGNTIWYFKDQELSSRQLERQEGEQFHQWFVQAKAEWDSMSLNRGLPFRAPDQPRNLVLERAFRSEPPAPNYFGYVLTLAPVILLIGLLYFVFNRQMKGVGNGAMNFGKAPVKLWQKGASKVTFKDVAGIEEAKEELTEIVDFLKDPGRFTALGARIPRGALLIGPPGTGKTLMAKAVAGEADRPFFSISGSDFVEMFVGVGASRIRDLFDQAKKNAPCIVFIDEIDAVGRHRGAGYGGGHDEREQTLNQLLVEMDGFGSNEGIILMAATNRPDVLDKALLRPGRFDRRIVIDLPDVRGRLEILKVHAQRVKMDPSVDLMSIARATPGASGADLANVLNEAALLAARRGRTAITSNDVSEASDKVRYGKERRSLELDEKEKRTTAYHETGHALVGLVVKHSDPVEKVTIVPRGMSLGATHFLPEKNKLSYWRNQVVDQLAVLMGGRAAEEICVGDVSSGAQQDIRQATSLARSMVCEWGMSDQLGLVAYDERNDSGQYLGLSSYKEKNYSEVTAERIDAEVKKLLDEAYAQARKILQDRRHQVETMTQALLEFESLDAEDVKLIVVDQWNADEKRKRVESADQRFKRVPPPVPPVTDSPGDFVPA